MTTNCDIHDVDTITNVYKVRISCNVLKSINMHINNLFSKRKATNLTAKLILGLYAHSFHLANDFMHLALEVIVKQSLGELYMDWPWPQIK